MLITYELAGITHAMLKFSIKPQWMLEGRDDAAQPLRRLLDLLAVIKEEGNLLRGTRRLGISYRHAWGIIREGAQIFGAPLLEMSRGRGAVLSPLGEKLLWADKRVAARLAPLLDSLASELEVEIERARSDSAPILRIQASHGFALELLRDFLLMHHIPVDLKYRGGMEALASFAGRDCEMAGLHVPVGDLQRAALNVYVKWLQPARHKLINLSTRRQGIMVACGNPKPVVSLADLARPGVRFVNRQFGSGTRILLDLLLLRERVDSRQIAGYDTGESTHAAVAAYIASGLADAGFGLETAARRMGLDFIPVVSERYFLIARNETLASPSVERIRDILSSKEFRATAGHLSGIDVTQAGTTLTLHEAFPDLPRRTRDRRRSHSALAPAAR